MKIFFRLSAAATLLCLCSMTASAGSPDGLEIVTLAAPAGAAYAGDISAFFDRFDHDITASNCENAQLNIAGVYKKNGDKGINAALGLAATKSRKQRDLLGRLMTAFRDKNHPRGFDAALVYNVDKDTLLLYGISPPASVRVGASVLPLADLKNPKKVDAAICHALITMPVLAEP